MVEVQDKMKIDYISDLHMGFVLNGKRSGDKKCEKIIRDFVDKTLPETLGDVLVLAGDIDEYNSISLQVLNEYARHYDKVFFVFGNHDLYITTRNQKGKMIDSYKRQDDLKRLVETRGLDNKIQILDRDIVEYKGRTFAGTTSWYTLPKERDIAWWGLYSNDSRMIYPRGIDASQERHKIDLNFYKSLEHEDIDVMITHVPPKHVGGRHEPNACYENVAIANLGLYAKHWVCGHQHVRVVEQLHETVVYVNAGGYPNEFREEPKIQSFFI